MSTLLEIIRGIFPKRRKQPGSISVYGPIEKEDGELVLRIPLAVGGHELFQYAKAIGRVDGHFLKVGIKPWMAEKLGVTEGTIMNVDNLTGEFRMQRYEEGPHQSPEPMATWIRGSA